MPAHGHPCWVVHKCLTHHPPTLSERLEQERPVRCMGSPFLRIRQGVTGRPAILNFVNCGFGVSQGQRRCIRKHSLRQIAVQINSC